jgi:hypothetical protein
LLLELVRGWALPEVDWPDDELPPDDCPWSRSAQATVISDPNKSVHVTIQMVLHIAIPSFLYSLGRRV